MTSATTHALVLFDGVCNFCNRRIDFIIRNDKHDLFRFAALQSEAGKKIQREHGLDATRLFSIILIENEKIYKKSTAFLRIMRLLGGKWKPFYALIIVPRFLRDAVYDFIAKNRYRWWGIRETCRTPSPGEEKKFLA